MIGISSFATNYLRTRTADRMQDSCRIFRRSGVTVDENFKASRGEAVVKYDGPCRIWEVTAGNQVIVSDQQVVVTQTYLSLPWDAPVPESDDIVLITASADSDLVGRTVAITGITRGGGLRASRRFTVTFVDSQSDAW